MKYRDDQKVCAKYIGMNEEDIAHVSEQLERRTIVEGFIKKLKIEQTKIKKREEIL